MIKILISFLICFAVSKDLIIIGDARIQEMSEVLMNVGYSEYDYRYSTYNFLMTENPVSYEGYNLEIIAVDQNTLEHLLGVAQPYNTVHDKLKKAKEGTSVLLSIGFQNLEDYNDIFIFYGKLADKYPKLNFYVVSIIGVNDDDPKSTINTNIKDFNKKVEKRIEIVGFTNLYYKNILYNNDPSQIVVDNEVINIFDYSTDSAGFFKNGYIKIFKALVEGL
jgi:hypothetical protein